MRRTIPITRRGDTIVEVLIVLGIISLILGGAFVTTNKNLQTSRDTQERVNALKLAEAQVEQIRNLTQTKEIDLFSNPSSTPYCIEPGPVKVATNNLYKYAAPRCLLRTDGTISDVGDAPVFAMTIVGPDANDVFEVRSTWVSLNNRTDANDNDDSDLNTVILKYRAHP